MKYIFILCILIVLGTSCKKKETKQAFSASFNPTENGVVTNVNSGTVQSYFEGAQGKELRIGWNSTGSAMRSFLTFDIASLATSGDEELEIDRAVLKVYESNTNLHPFDGDGTIRTVQAYLIEYDALDGSDFYSTSIYEMGTIATDGYNVLNEYALNFTNQLSAYLTDHEPGDLQLMLALTEDNNVADNSPLASSMWNVFAVEENNDYIPVVEIRYSHVKKD